MKIRSARFATSAPDLAGAPAWDLPEFALIGRSNVGKSTLVNLLANHGNLAKVSATPGKTRLINFFTMNDNWSLVDLPGYGFAKVAQTQKGAFIEAVADYLSQRPNLRFVFVLIDSRLPPQAIDLDFIGWLSSTGRPFGLVFTKVDKQSPTKTRANIRAIEAAVAELHPDPLPAFTTSSKTREGPREILHAIGDMLRPPQ
jgi:GTP-binding protein